MASTSKGFVTCKKSAINCDRVFRDCGPGLHFVQEMFSPIPPKCLKVLAYFTNCINSCDRLERCVVPTVFTRPKVDHKKVVGIEHVTEELSELHRDGEIMDLASLMQYQVAVEVHPCPTARAARYVPGYGPF